MVTRAHAALIAGLLLAATQGHAHAQDPQPVPATSAAPAPAPSPTGGVGWNEGPGPAKKISVGLLLGYGISFNDINPFGFGIGIRGGYNLQQIYLGARFVYNVGTSDERLTSGGPIAEYDYSLWDLGVEGGYDMPLIDKLTVRPEVGLGLAGFSVESNYAFDAPETSSTRFYFALGGTGVYDLRPNIFVGLDARLQFVFADDLLAALTFLINGGLRF